MPRTRPYANKLPPLPKRERIERKKPNQTKRDATLKAEAQIDFLISALSHIALSPDERVMDGMGRRAKIKYLRKLGRKKKRAIEANEYAKDHKAWRRLKSADRMIGFDRPVDRVAARVIRKK